MTGEDNNRRARPVPAGRLSRLAGFGTMAGGIVGNALIDGAGRLARGQRPRLSELMLNPRNVARATDELARMRGAAMKLGQLLSMDAGDLLPPELAGIMARLRADADPMPVAQVEGVLAREWGANWRERLEYLSPRPIAAASIGQVHRALTRDGRDLAIKVQYPGIARSIDSDVDNVASLIRLAGLIPRHLTIAPLLEEAKRQLHEEADYRLEAAKLRCFADLVAGDERFVTPSVDDELSTGTVLAMSHIDSLPLETGFEAPQARRDAIALALIDLALRELFDFNFVQTDPNPANYRLEREGSRVVLLDFGAARSFDPALVAQCRRLLRAARSDDRELAGRTIIEMGLSDEAMPARKHEQILQLFSIASGYVRGGGPVDFGNDPVLRSLREEAMAMSQTPEVTLVPPAAPLFLQRKFAGIYLIVLRLRARVDVQPLVDRHLEGGVTPAP